MILKYQLYMKVVIAKRRMRIINIKKKSTVSKQQQKIITWFLDIRFVFLSSLQSFRRSVFQGIRVLSQRTVGYPI